MGIGVIALYAGVLVLAGQMEMTKPKAYEPLAVASPGTQSSPPPELKAKLKEGTNWLHFYRQECPCSRAATGHVAALKRRYHDLNWVGINVGETPGPAKDPFVGVTLDGDHLWDESGVLAATYGIRSTPAAVLVDSAGKVQWKGSYREVGEHPGYTAEDALADLASGEPFQPGQLGDGCVIP